MRFANLINRENNPATNFGDIIQYYSIENIYSEMEEISYHDVVRLSDKDFLNYSKDEYLILPMNMPFWGDYDMIPERIIPVYLGISLKDESQIQPLRLKEFEPIGCRDQYTYNLLTENGIRAYLNGCMTLALPRRDRNIKGDKVYVIDACDELVQKIPKELKDKAIFKNHVIWDEKQKTESEILSEYEQYKKDAALVISSRMHAVVPCIAFGIPVIFASPFIPTRVDWLNKLIPLYDRNSFDEINWYPEALEIEELKEKLIKNAIKRIRDTENKYRSICEISEYFYNGNGTVCEEEDLVSLKKYFEQKKSSHNFKYILWGMTATTRRVLKYLSANFPDSEFIGIIDLYRQIEIQGKKTQGIDLLNSVDENTIVFVTAERANVMALKEFKLRNITNYVLCWDNPGDGILHARM